MQQEIRDIVVLIQSSASGTAQTSGNPYVNYPPLIEAEAWKSLS